MQKLTQTEILLATLVESRLEGAGSNPNQNMKLLVYPHYLRNGKKIVTNFSVPSRPERALSRTDAVRSRNGQLCPILYSCPPSLRFWDDGIYVVIVPFIKALE